jgi:hypothetical protein
MLVLTRDCLTLINPDNLLINRKISIQSALYSHISASGSLVAIAHQCDAITFLSLDSELTSLLSIPGVIHSIAFLPRTSLLLILHTRENGGHCISSYRSSQQTSFLLLHTGLMKILISKGIRYHLHYTQSPHILLLSQHNQVYTEFNL